MARPKKVVSEKMQKLLNQQAELKATLTFNRDQYKEFVKAENKLADINYRIMVLKEKEIAKAKGSKG